jgi:hypothetical protein
VISLDGVRNTDGLLFVSVQCNDDKTACVAPVSNGTDWKIAIRDNAQVFGFEDDHFGYLYLPYRSQEFILGSVDADGAVLRSNAEFTVTQEAQGTYRLSIAGASVASGMLLLNGYGVDGNGDPEHVRMGYEADGDDFIVTCYGLGVSPALSSSAFVFAYIPFDGEWTFENTFGSTNLADFGRFSKAWKTTSADAAYNADWDYDGNNAVDVSDLMQFAAYWLQ